MDKRRLVWTKVKEYLGGIKAGLKFYGVNSFFIYVPFLFILTGVITYAFLCAYGYTKSSTLFVEAGNAYLAEQGIAQRFIAPTYWESVLRVLEVLRINTFADESIAASGIKDPDVIAKLGEINRGCIAEGALAILGGMVLLFLLFFVGSFVTTFFIKKRNGVPYGWKLTLLGVLLKFVVFAGIIAGLGALFGLIPVVGGIFAAVVIPLAQALFALYRGYLIQCGVKKTLKMFRFVTFKDVLIYVTLTVILDGLVAIVGIFFSAVVAEYIALILLFAMPLLSYTNAYLDAYAEVYILKKVDRLALAQSQGKAKA